VGPDHPFRALSPETHVRLAPLGEADLAELATSMAGSELPPEALDLVVRLSEGSPFLAAGVMQGLVETGALVEGDGGFRLERDALGDVQSSRRAAAFLSKRLDRL